MAVLSEIVNGLILADFCYYYMFMYVKCFDFANFLIISYTFLGSTL
jgi:hypothetical protein